MQVHLQYGVPSPGTFFFCQLPLPLWWRFKTPNSGSSGHRYGTGYRYRIQVQVTVDGSGTVGPFEIASAVNCQNGPLPVPCPLRASAAAAACVWCIFSCGRKCSAPVLSTAHVKKVEASQLQLQLSCLRLRLHLQFLHPTRRNLHNLLRSLTYSLTPTAHRNRIASIALLQSPSRVIMANIIWYVPPQTPLNSPPALNSQFN